MRVSTETSKLGKLEGWSEIILDLITLDWRWGGRVYLDVSLYPDFVINLLIDLRQEPLTTL